MSYDHWSSHTIYLKPKNAYGQLAEGSQAPLSVQDHSKLLWHPLARNPQLEITRQAPECFHSVRGFWPACAEFLEAVASVTGASVRQVPNFFLVWNLIYGKRESCIQVSLRSSKYDSSAPSPIATPVLFLSHLLLCFLFPTAAFSPWSVMCPTKAACSAFAAGWPPSDLQDRG